MYYVFICCIMFLLTTELYIYLPPNFHDYLVVWVCLVSRCLHQYVFFYIFLWLKLDHKPKWNPSKLDTLYNRILSIQNKASCPKSTFLYINKHFKPENLLTCLVTRAVYAKDTGP